MPLRELIHQMKGQYHRTKIQSLLIIDPNILNCLRFSAWSWPPHKDLYQMHNQAPCCSKTSWISYLDETGATKWDKSASPQLSTFNKHAGVLGCTPFFTHGGCIVCMQHSRQSPMHLDETTQRLRRKKHNKKTKETLLWNSYIQSKNKGIFEDETENRNCFHFLRYC